MSNENEAVQELRRALAEFGQETHALTQSMQELRLSISGWRESLDEAIGANIQTATGLLDDINQLLADPQCLEQFKEKMRLVRERRALENQEATQQASEE